jgi:hypothetical protein
MLGQAAGCSISQQNTIGHLEYHSISLKNKKAHTLIV